MSVTKTDNHNMHLSLSDRVFNVWQLFPFLRRFYTEATLPH